MMRRFISRAELQSILGVEKVEVSRRGVGIFVEGESQATQGYGVVVVKKRKLPEEKRAETNNDGTQAVVETDP